MASDKNLTFKFESLERDGTLNDDWQILLRIVADFYILIDSKVLYREQQFCVVEFAVALSKWLSGANHTGEDFIYESIEAEEDGLVWIKAHGSGWRIGSIYQEYEEGHTFSLEEVRSAADSFINQLAKGVLVKFRVDLREFIIKRWGVIPTAT
jgi:hypothetical protein